MSNPTPKPTKIILGIDPGTNVMGYGVIRVTGNKAELVVMGVIDMRKEKDPYLRLGKIFERVTGIIKEYLPDEMAIEAPSSVRTYSRCSSSDAHRSSHRSGHTPRRAHTRVRTAENQDGYHGQRLSFEGTGGWHAATTAETPRRPDAPIHGRHRRTGCRLLPFHADESARSRRPTLQFVEGFRKEKRVAHHQIKRKTTITKRKSCYNDETIRKKEHYRRIGTQKDKKMKKLF